MPYLFVIGLYGLKLFYKRSIHTYNFVYFWHIKLVIALVNQKLVIPKVHFNKHNKNNSNKKKSNKSEIRITFKYKAL